MIVALSIGESPFSYQYIPVVLLLGFVAYGLSIFSYIRAQKKLGAAKTGAYYSIAPFIGAFFAFVFLDEPLSMQYVLALLVMIVGTVFIVYDTLARSHSHEHSHIHNNVTHSHSHDHFSEVDVHNH